MSEPMSSGEIEDVLSSIRRLVSEELRPMARPAASATLAAPSDAAAKPDPAEAEKLILTPALRIVPNEPRIAPRPDTTPVSQLNVGADADAGADVNADTGDAFGLSASSAAVEGGFEPDQLPEESDAAWHGSYDDWIPEAEAEADLHGDLAQPALQLTSVVSAIGTAVDENADDWESETGDAGFSDLTGKAPIWAEDVEEAAMAIDVETAEEAEIAAIYPAAKPGANPAGASETPTETPPETTPETPTEITPETTPVSGAEDSPAFQAKARPALTSGPGQAAEQALNDLAEAEAVAEIIRGAASLGQTDAPAQQAPQQDHTSATPETDAMAAPDEVYYDEAVLRDLVRDLIREELNGALGERITRNVRKLVRAEVHRALTSREFE